MHRPTHNSTPSHERAPYPTHPYPHHRQTPTRHHRLTHPHPRHHRLLALLESTHGRHSALVADQLYSLSANLLVQGQGAESERLAERGYRVFREKVVLSTHQQLQVGVSRTQTTVHPPPLWMDRSPTPPPAHHTRSSPA